MSDAALQAILDRDGVSAVIGIDFVNQVDLLDELVDYGTNLMARAFGSSPKDFEATYLLFVHLQQFVAHLDGVAVLLKKGSCLTAHLQLRTMLENLLALKWLLADDTANKVEHIHVANLRQRKHWQEILIPDSKESKKHAVAAARLAPTPEQLASVPGYIAKIEEMLADPARRPINKKFEEFYAKKGYDPHWYTRCGAPTIRQIAVQQGNTEWYDYLYSPFSGVTHGGDIWKSIIFRKGLVQVNPIRGAEEIPKLCNLAASFALDTYRLILTKYRHAELDNFGQKYLAEWRHRYRKVFNIEVKPQFVAL